MPKQDLARAAFEAYSTAIAGIAPDGHLIPSWEQLGPTVQGVWLAAASAVCSRVTPPIGQIAELVIAASEVVSSIGGPAQHRAVPAEAVWRLQQALSEISSVGVAQVQPRVESGPAGHVDRDL